MKAKLLSTALIFIALPISIDRAYSVPLKDSMAGVNPTANFALRSTPQLERDNVDDRAFTSSDGEPTLVQTRPAAQKNRTLQRKLQVTNLDPQAAINYNNQGVAKFKSGDNYGAIKDYDRAIAIDPKYSESYVNRGIAKFKLGKIQAAIKDYNLAIAINAKDSEAYYNRGIAQFESGDERLAVADFDRAIAINPQDPEVYGNRGFAKSTLGDKQGALADFDRAAKLFQQQGQTADSEKMMELVRQMSTY